MSRPAPKGVSSPTEWKKARRTVKRKTLAGGKTWPSAYASSQVVNEYKKRMSRRGLAPYTSKKPRHPKGIDRWHKEKWVDVCTGKPCGRGKKSKRKYPYCRPTVRVTKRTPVLRSELSLEKRKQLCSKKRARPKKRMSRIRRGKKKR